MRGVINSNGILEGTYHLLKAKILQTLIPGAGTHILVNSLLNEPFVHLCISKQMYRVTMPAALRFDDRSGAGIVTLYICLIRNFTPLKLI